jgi:hypothetical protein
MTTCYAMNAATGSIVTYTGSFASATGIAAVDEGLYLSTATTFLEHDGSDDTGSAVAAHILTGDLFLAGPYEANVPSCMYTNKGSGNVGFTRYVKDTGTTITCDTYSVPMFSDWGIQHLTLEARQEARAYSFKIALDTPDDAVQDFTIYVNPVRPRYV